MIKYVIVYILLNVSIKVLNPCEVASNMSRYDGIEFGHRSTEMSSTEALLSNVRCHG